MNADPRLTAATEYLGYARNIKVADLPHSALMRMAAELRRQLGRVLDYVTENAPLTGEQRAVLGHALGDAIAWHTDPEPCGSCEYMAPALCAEHAEACGCGTRTSGCPRAGDRGDPVSARHEVKARVLLTWLAWRHRVRRWRFRARDKAYDVRWVAIATVMNRWAPAELRHAALLLGYDAALGYGSVLALLGHLHEFTVGMELGESVRYGEEDTGLHPVRAAEMFSLERSLYGFRREWVSR